MPSSDCLTYQLSNPTVREHRAFIFLKGGAGDPLQTTPSSYAETIIYSLSPPSTPVRLPNTLRVRYRRLFVADLRYAPPG